MRAETLSCLIRELAPFLGKQVQVTYAHAEPGEPRKIIDGMLLGLGEDGEFIVQDKMGIVHYCWPLLDIRLLEASCDL